jgi:protein-S-isoprenylcysteine O-methyltransferase Ste14
LRPMSRQSLSVLLVALQFGLIAMLAVIAGPAFIGASAPAGAWLSAACGGLLGVWSLASNRPGNFNIRPLPRDGGRLVQSGPYRWIRHPMYTAVMLYGLACAWANPLASAWLALAALVAVLASKASLEERWMQTAHADYADYRARTRRFLPGIF